jgi:hypothetical protein
VCENVRYKVCHRFHDVRPKNTVHILAASYETDVGSPQSLLHDTYAIAKADTPLFLQNSASAASHKEEEGNNDQGKEENW